MGNVFIFVLYLFIAKDCVVLCTKVEGTAGFFQASPGWFFHFFWPLRCQSEVLAKCYKRYHSLSICHPAFPTLAKRLSAGSVSVGRREGGKEGR